MIKKYVKVSAIDAEKETLLDDAQHTSMFQLKKKLLMISLVLRYFCCGLEYSIIMPTALLYVASLSGGKGFMGLVIGLYPLAAMITLPLFGYMYDRTKKIRELLILLNCFQIIGNFVYAIPLSKWLPLLGRFISGLGDGFIALTVGEVTYLYAESDRIGILSLMEMSRVLGVIIGPTVNFAIEDWKIKFHQWSLDNKNLPGFIMGCCWIVVQLVTICCVYNLTLELEKSKLNGSPYLHKKRNEIGAEEEIVEMKNKEYVNSEADLLFCTDDVDDSKCKRSDGISEFNPDDVFPIPERKEQPLPLRGKVSSYCYRLKERIYDSSAISFFHSSLSAIIYIEFLVIFLVNLIIWYSQTTFEVLCPYVTEFEYKWTPQETGAVYMVGGAVIVIVFIALFVFRRFCSRKEVSLLVISLIFTQISMGLMIYEYVPKSLTVRVICFIIIALFVFMSIPLNLVCVKTLLTRMVRREYQGTVQGISSSISRIAMISGPFLSGFIFTNRQVYASIMTVFAFGSIVALLLCKEKIYRREKEVREGTGRFR